jgi:P63C domain
MDEIQTPVKAQSGKVRSGKARMEKLTPDERSSLASLAAKERWRKRRELVAAENMPPMPAILTQEQSRTTESPIVSAQVAPEVSAEILPKATHWGELQIGDASIPCYVLDTEERVFSLKGAVVGLIETEGGQLAEYIKVKSLRQFLPADLIPTDDESQRDRIPALIRFDVGGDNPKAAFRFPWGLPVEKFMDLCDAYSRAAEAGDLTERQQRIARNANKFLRACRNIGIIALVDEATGYQKVRPLDELQFKLKLYLEEKMRDWEPTFPDALWQEFARLTNWKKPTHIRPKFWGKLVMELIYGYLDADVAEWLRNNAPRPMHGQNYHQWLTEQYGLKRLIEHIWKVVGIASTCKTIDELKAQMRHQYGRVLEYKIAVNFVKESEATGQSVLFDPKELFS